MPETKNHDGGLIARSNRMFFQISRVGEIDNKGKTVFSIGFKGKRVAEPDRPLACMMGFIHNCIVTAFTYSSPEEGEKDIAILKAYVNGLHITAPTTEQEER